MKNIAIRAFRPDDAGALDSIRAAAFEPVFTSFRNILGHELYTLAQARDDERQGDLLASMLAPDSIWEVFVAQREGTPIGFVSVRLDPDTLVGEIGLNAVHPDEAGNGVGTMMYEFAVQRMSAAGMRAATVSTGGDPSHAPARRAYEKAGFATSIPGVWMCRLL